MTITEVVRKMAGGSSVKILLCEVLNVDSGVCDLRPLDGQADILDAKLQVSQGMLLEPTVGSVVMVAEDGKQSAVLLYSEIDLAKIQVGSQELALSSNGAKLSGELKIEGSFGVASQVSDLKACIEELIDFLLAIQVINPAVGNSVLLPALAPQLTALKAKFNTFLKS